MFFIRNSSIYKVRRWRHSQSPRFFI